MAQRASARGFTLIEVMIAVAIIGVLSMVALPSFLDSMRKSRRAEAITALAALQQAQERFRSTASGYYAIAITAATATGYTATASARNGTSQANDGNCKVLGVQMNAGNLSYGASATSTIDWTDPNRCWAR